VQCGDVIDGSDRGDARVLKHTPIGIGQQLSQPGVHDMVGNVSGSRCLPSEFEGQQAAFR
jgi:hypothetical protein